MKLANFALILPLLLAPAAAQACIGSNPETCGCDSVLQNDYRGDISTTVSGRTCQSWGSQSPHSHSRTAANYPDKGLGDHNYCRNPDGEPRAWCYTTDPAKRWEYCDVTYCSTTDPYVANADPQNCGPVIDIGGNCDLAKLTAAISGTTCTLEELFPGQDAAGIAATVADLCEYDARVQFVEIQGTYQLDHRYMDGGGDVADETYGFAMDTARLNRFITNSMDNSIIDWPEYEQKEDYNPANGYGDNGYMTNFNIDPDAEKGSCQMNTVMCCFTDSAMDELVDNTDICHHDLSSSPQSNHVYNGWSVFTNDDSAHCVGFTWEDGTVSDTYKGNALFYASLYQTTKKGYMSNVPGAPMCACMEQMPVVTKAECVTATGSGLSYQFTVDSDGEVSATHSVTMAYTDCGGNDLKAQVKAVHAGTSIETDIDEYLVGADSCEVKNADYLNEEQLLITGASDRFTDMDGVLEQGRTWKQVFGEGIFFLPPHLDAAEADEEMRTLMEACIPSLGRYCMLIRKCSSCTSEPHRNIVYQRLTPFPDYKEGISTDTTMDVPNLFMNQWRAKNNVMHVDYELYSSVTDALSQENEWLVSDYNNNNNNYGFPRNSGPTTHIGNQWNSYRWHGAYANNHGFYVEVPSASTSA
mmetsp:Transcript_27250/g.42811  ORF Transcript_27250/g.42811 Transcript_27250/m.42811 type:complete len:640 (+) Transcript_27250:138-2057(+)